MTDILTNYFSNYEKEIDNPLYVHDIILIDNNILSFSPKPVIACKSLSTDKSYHIPTNSNNLSKKLSINQSSNSILGNSANNKRTLSNITAATRIYDYSTNHSNQKKYPIDKNSLNTERCYKKFYRLNLDKKERFINYNDTPFFKNKMQKKLYKGNSKTLNNVKFNNNKKIKIDKIIQNLIKKGKCKKFNIKKNESSFKNQKSKELKIINYSNEYIKFKFLKEINNPKAFKSLKIQKSILDNENIEIVY